MQTIAGFKKLILSAAFLILVITGCRDSLLLDSGSILVEHPPALNADNISILNVNDINIAIADNGNVVNAPPSPFYSFYSTGKTSVNISSSGLWIGTDESIPRVNLVGYKWNSRSNFSPIWDTVKAGVFHVTSEMRFLSPSKSLVRLGFPVTQSAKIKLYGDEMCWMSLHGKKIEGIPLFSSPLTDIRVNQTVFAYKRADLRNVLFIRYDIKNISTHTINNIYTGYWSDTDVDIDYSSSNSTGYDYSRSFTYTYVKEKLLSNATLNASKLIVGFTFVTSPITDSQYPNGVTSHRIIRKDSYINPEFGEQTLECQGVINALRGLSNSGNPMIDPTTNQITRFAFTGNPADGSGWIDSSVDSRNMISTGPFSLQSQETKTLVILWICYGGKNFSISMTKIRAQLDMIRNEPSLWNY